MGQVLTLRTMARMETYFLQIAFWLTVVVGGTGTGADPVGPVQRAVVLVEQRTREIGVRMALGATTRAVARLVLSQSIRPVGIGLLIGAGMSVGLATLLMATPAADHRPNRACVRSGRLRREPVDHRGSVSGGRLDSRKARRSPRSDAGASPGVGREASNIIPATGPFASRRRSPRRGRNPRGTRLGPAAWARETGDARQLTRPAFQRRTRNVNRFNNCDHEPMPLTPGTRLGWFLIEAPLGAGGMGEVYKAKDTRLDRTVAIKILPSADPDLKARFEREAKAIAGLQHQHICTLYDVGHEGSTDYLVLEYLVGETLADRLARGPLKLEDALKMAIEVADALDKAHLCRHRASRSQTRKHHGDEGWRQAARFRSREAAAAHCRRSAACR